MTKIVENMSPGKEISDKILYLSMDSGNALFPGVPKQYFPPFHVFLMAFGGRGLSFWRMNLALWLKTWFRKGSGKKSRNILVVAEGMPW